MKSNITFAVTQYSTQSKVVVRYNRIMYHVEKYNKILKSKLFLILPSVQFVPKGNILFLLFQKINYLLLLRLPPLLLLSPLLLLPPLLLLLLLPPLVGPPPLPR
jgi:hypothetical protein